MTEKKEIKEIIIHFLGVISGIVIMIWYFLDIFAGNMMGKMTRSLERLITEMILFVEVNMILFIALSWILLYGGFLFNQELKE